MKIYTKGGDSGETGLVGGTRVPKDDLRIRTYGTLDEVNALFGLILSENGIPEKARASLNRLQGELFQLGAELATPRGRSPSDQAWIAATQVMGLEAEIDSMELELPPLKTFILPGGIKAAAWVHLARTVSRRGERELVSLNRSEPVRPIILQYMNRLSDFLFVLARYFNYRSSVADIPWIAPSVKD